jgi:chorismate mutase
MTDIRKEYDELLKSCHEIMSERDHYRIALKEIAQSKNHFLGIQEPTREAKRAIDALDYGRCEGTDND